MLITIVRENTNIKALFWDMEIFYLIPGARYWSFQRSSKCHSAWNTVIRENDQGKKDISIRINSVMILFL